MRGLIRILNSQAGLGLAILRVVMGLIFLYAGYGKVFKGGFAVGGFRNMGLPFPEILGPVASFLELGGGALLVIGLFTRYLGILFTGQFIVATLVIYNLKGLAGARLEIMILLGAIILATNGAGVLGLDRPGQRWEP